jgi:TetR/AcrR family transcriptional repressor of nem operon
MARPKEFDRDVVLDKAMALFWRQGYEATSIQDLVTHTGINRQSLYDTFGSKHQLYLAVMDRYIDRVVSRRLAVVNATQSSTAAIRQFFSDVVEFAVSDADNKG